MKANPGPGLKTKEACLIARVDRQQFNEAVSKGFYPCAVATVPGSSRVFRVPDVVALMIFGRLLALGCSTKEAGSLACKAHTCIVGFITDCVVGGEDVDKVLAANPFLVLQFGEMGEPQAFITSDMRRAFKPLIGGISVRQIMAFDVNVLRDLVRQHIRHLQENPVYGEDD